MYHLHWRAIYGPGTGRGTGCFTLEDATRYARDLNGPPPPLFTVDIDGNFTVDWRPKRYTEHWVEPAPKGECA